MFKNINIQSVKQQDLPQLAEMIRQKIIDIVSSKEGHLGASLGVVELTIALHHFYKFPHDKLIWDVGHQAYPHKLLTGRSLETLRQLNGISGFPSRKESIYDDFGTGHSSTSISAILGMALASNLKREKRNHIAVIGDASIASGMAFEALNHAGATHSNLTIILNDNQIGIDPSVGALKKHLSYINREKNQSEIQNIFEALGFYYYGPIDGHDFNALLQAFEDLKAIQAPKFLHVSTIKGKGYKKAEEEQITWHSPGKFNKITGERLNHNSENQPSKFQDVFGKTLCELADNNPRIFGITPAMPTGSSLKYMIEQFPERAIDVGIAEQHAVTLAAGLATQGFKPYVAIYSTFLQRAYDQVIHDVALQNLPVVFCIDRAGLVGEDGATHHGLFDIALLNSIPNLIISAPFDEIELRNLLFTSQNTSQPFTIRYPRGVGYQMKWKQDFTKLEIGKAVIKKKGSQVAVLSTGTIGNSIASLNASFTHIHFPFIKPLDYKVLDEILQTHQTVITYEESVIKGGFGQQVLHYAQKKSYTGRILVQGYPDIFIEHGTIEELKEQIGLSEKQIHAFILDILAQ
ncbi:MAG: 1-deoxy-D-xylulose-5-phosphate synthase [Flavobacteriales bacterium]